MPDMDTHVKDATIRDTHSGLFESDTHAGGDTLDLRVTDQMMQSVMEDAEEPQSVSPADTDRLKLDHIQPEPRVKLGGQVFLDDNWQQDYRQAIDGAQVDIEVKFAE